jgi:microsomal dipeptidase-like Zn-dependent dipeptidase
MRRRGWSEARVGKFMGGNLLRVFRVVTEKEPSTRRRGDR